MSLTHFPHGVSSFGVPLMGGGGMLPKMGGAGEVFFVDPANGSDSNDGKTPENALDTVSAAYAKTVDKRGDVVYLLNDGNTSGASRETASITWAKDNTHLVGLCAPVGISQRARITPVSGNTDLDAYTPMITVSGHGNIFSNVQIAPWGSEDGKAARGVDVTGNRNFFYNCHIIGIVHANVGDEANACDLKISGGEENLFKKCTFGTDTIARSTTCASVELVSAATRNIFEDCLFLSIDDAGDSLFVKVDGAGDIDRFVLFKNCTFINAVESTGTALTSACNVNNAAGGLVMFHSCQMAGVTDIAAADNGNVWVDGVGGAATGSLSIVATQ